MEKFVKKIQTQYTKNLENSALGYLTIGLDLFHQREGFNLNFQVVMGNLSIAIELMLKAFLSSRNLLLLFKDVPLDFKTLLSCSKDTPRTFNWRKIDIGLSSGTYKTIDFDTCISSFYIFFPDLKQSLHSHMRFLANNRNTSVHFVFPSFQKYEIERVVFVALKMFLTIKQSKACKFTYYQLNDNDKRFLKQFDEDRIKRVKKKIDEAKAKSTKIQHLGASISIDSWEYYITDCPICGSDAILDGYTEKDAEQAMDGYPEPYLSFFADAFKCDDCGLSLDDSEEIRLAGKDIIYDRSDELNEWISENDEGYLE
jgi:hypothetical protein